VRNSLKVSAIVLAIAGFLGTVLTIPVVAGDESGGCTLTRLPAEMQRHIQTNYSSWRLQDVSSLSATAKERWQSEKPVDCPGIAVGQFENMNQKSYAVLLVPADKPDTGYRLLVFTPNRRQAPKRFKAVEQSDKIGASNFFVHQIQITKVFSAEWEKKLRANTRDGILFVDAGESEYETDVYFWTGDEYGRKPIDY
jgi:hypothetical protein